MATRLLEQYKWTKDGRKWVFYCWIPLLNGKVESIKNLVGKEVYVYSWDLLKNQVEDALFYILTFVSVLCIIHKNKKGN